MTVQLAERIFCLVPSAPGGSYFRLGIRGWASLWLFCILVQGPDWCWGISCQPRLGLRLCSFSGWGCLFSWYGNKEKEADYYKQLASDEPPWVSLCAASWDSRAVLFVFEVTTVFFFFPPNCCFWKNWWILIYLSSFLGGRGKNNNKKCLICDAPGEC